MVGITHGRGGAGNMSYGADEPVRPTKDDLTTPTIKADTYTTGRGGSGNMAHNDASRPELARQAQDVEVPLAVFRQDEPSRKVVVGRGGAANVVSSCREGTEADCEPAPGPGHVDQKPGEKTGECDQPTSQDDWATYFRSLLSRLGIV